MRAAWLRALAPWALAALFAVLALRSLPCANVIDTDAARHAMNGAFLYDLARSGEALHPVAFGQRYYGRLPSVSLPYHPPMFPAIEAAFFGVFGVKLWAARAAIALAVAVSALLLYRLVLQTHGSQAVAFASVTAFFGWRMMQALSNDIMLEVPSLAFALAALVVMPKRGRSWRAAPALAFALLAAAAVWSKQTAVFLGAVPFVCAALAGRWRVLRSAALWGAAAVFGALVFALTTLSARFHGTGVTSASQAQYFGEYIVNNTPFYLAAMARSLGLVPALAAGAAVVFALARRKASDALYLAWAGSAAAVLLLIGLYDERYLFFVVAPVAVMAFAQLERAGAFIARRWPRTPARQAGLLAPLVAAVSFAAVNVATPVPSLKGPEAAAAAVMTGAPERVLYCGRTNGSFIFALRSLDPNLETAVVRGDKLPPAVFAPGAFASFARRYGIRYAVLERSVIRRPWDRLFDHPERPMELVREIAQPATDALADGRLRVYRLPLPEATPEPLHLRLERIGEELEVKF
jgi:4-amino-4-deoxy-L-arabinose transferase-like glycosyltransferase